jgi:predicted flap endonuclease-1-like 5' DNA nuclease
MKRKTASTAPVWPRGVAAPAQRALAGAGITQLEQLAKWTESDLLALHGMGPKAIGLLRDALRAKGLSFKA